MQSESVMATPAKEGDLKIPRPDRLQQARAKLNSIEGPAIIVERDLIARAAGEIVEDHPRQHGAGQVFVFVKVDRLGHFSFSFQCSVFSWRH